MNEYNKQPDSAAEKLMWDVFHGREREAIAQHSTLRLANMLNAGPRRRPQPRLHVALRVSLVVCALFVLGGWASTLNVRGYDDGQQITIELPQDWVPADNPRWVAIFSKHADALLDKGGHSLVADYSRNAEGRYYMQLGLIGVDYQAANEWIRQVMQQVPDVAVTTYSIDQPMVRYRVRVADMIAYKLGSTAAIERNVVRAWLSPSQGSMEPRHIFLIAQPQDYAKRVSMIDY